MPNIRRRWGSVYGLESQVNINGPRQQHSSSLLNYLEDTMSSNSNNETSNSNSNTVPSLRSVLEKAGPPDNYHELVMRLLFCTTIVAGSSHYRIREIELYHVDDPYTHQGDEQVSSTGGWYFHRTKPGGGWKGGTFLGLDISFRPIGTAGGVLIRGLSRVVPRDDTSSYQYVDGSCNCVKELLKACGVHKIKELVEHPNFKWDALDTNSILYLKEHEPIGCSGNPNSKKALNPDAKMEWKACSRIGLSEPSKFPHKAQAREQYHLAPLRFLQAPYETKKEKTKIKNSTVTGVFSHEEYNQLNQQQQQQEQGKDEAAKAKKKASKDTNMMTNKGGPVWHYWLDVGMDGMSRGWHSYTSDACAKLEGFLKNKGARLGRTTWHLKSGYFSYAVDISKMTQTNMSSGTVRPIRRVLPGEVCSMSEPPIHIPPKKSAATKQTPESDDDDSDDEPLSSTTQKTKKHKHVGILDDVDDLEFITTAKKKAPPTMDASTPNKKAKLNDGKAHSNHCRPLWLVEGVCVKVDGVVGECVINKVTSDSTALVQLSDKTHLKPTSTDQLTMIPPKEHDTALVFGCTTHTGSSRGKPPGRKGTGHKIIPGGSSRGKPPGRKGTGHKIIPGSSLGENRKRKESETSKTNSTGLNAQDTTGRVGTIGELVCIDGSDAILKCGEDYRIVGYDWIAKIRSGSTTSKKGGPAWLVEMVRVRVNNVQATGEWVIKKVLSDSSVFVQTLDGKSTQAVGAEDLTLVKPQEKDRVLVLSGESAGKHGELHSVHDEKAAVLIEGKDMHQVLHCDCLAKIGSGGSKPISQPIKKSPQDNTPNAANASSKQNHASSQDKEEDDGDDLKLGPLFVGKYGDRWDAALAPVIEAQPKAAEFIGPNRSKDVLPLREMTFRALMAVAPEQNNLIVFGQGPYPRVESASGIAMFDTLIKDWDSPQFGKTVSMRCIAKTAAVAKGIAGQDANVKALRKAFKENNIVSPPEWFQAMLAQGVLLLNASLTIGANMSTAKHTNFWKPVMKAIVKQILQAKRDQFPAGSPKRRVAFLWWGNEALKTKKFLAPLLAEYQQDVEITHIEHFNPAAQGDKFSQPPNHFQAVNDALVKGNLGPIDWLPNKDWLKEHHVDEHAAFITDTQELHQMYLDRLQAGLDLTDLKPILGIMEMELLSLPDACDDLGLKSTAASALTTVQEFKEEVLDDNEKGAIYLYTTNVLYRRLNEALRNSNRSRVKVYFKYLRVFLQAYAKMKAEPKMLYRGINKDLSSQYTKGAQAVWWNVSSCTPNLGVAKNFGGGSSSGTLFHVKAKTAVPIMHLSAYQTEEEWVLAPGTVLRVESVVKKPNQATEIFLEEIEGKRWVK